MKKALLIILGLTGIIGALSIGVVKADDGIIFNPDAGVTYIDTNGNVFSGIGTITLTYSGKSITMLDRNLGATSNNRNDESSYGYVFQWGNNYGFSHCYSNGCASFLSGEITSNTQLNVEVYNNNPSTFSSKSFIIGNRNRTTNDTLANLRGGSGDNYDNGWGISGLTIQDIKNRKGPCPDGYHIPSIGERNMLITYWYNYIEEEELDIGNLNMINMVSTGKNFLNDFFIPLAGSRSFRNAAINELNNLAQLWASSPYIGPYSRYPSLKPNSLDVTNYHNRANGLSIRCFYDYYLFPYKFSFIDRDIELISGSLISGEKIIDIIDIAELDITREGYNLAYWYTEGKENNPYDFTGTVITGDITLYAKRIPITYTIIFDTDGGSEIAPVMANYGTGITPPNNPSKNGYEFVRREPEIPSIMPIGGLTVKAIWKNLGSSGGGGRSNKISDTQDSNFTQDEKNTENVIQSEMKGSEESSNTSIDSQLTEQVSDNDSKGGQTYTPEFQQAYEFAKGHGITTMPSIQEADMDGKLTRIAMAKMLSQYAINVLGQKTSEVEVPKFNDVTDKQNSDYDNGVTLSYQLGIMGQNMPNNKFRPDDEVTRAEFATALSRMIYKTTDGQYKLTPEYYVNHMKKLVEEGIITKDDPKMKELRGYVMIMLMRSAK